MTTGVIVAGIGDIDFNPSAYIYCAVSIIGQAGYLSSIQKHGESSSNAAASSSLQSLYDCSILSAPILFVIFIISGEPTQVIYQLAKFSGSTYVLFILLLVSNVLSGSLLCFSQFWCTLNNNAVTTSVLGELKSMLQTLIGIMLFQSWGSFRCNLCRHCY
jgi:solute carrier family 35 protein